MATGYRTDVRGVRRTRTPSDLIRELDVEVAREPRESLTDERTDLSGREPAEQGDGALDVTEALETLRHRGWTVLHDLHWPGRPGETVDHVVVGRGGVVVVHVRSWSGTVTAADGWLRQNGFRRDRELDKAYAATAAIASLLRPVHRASTIGLLCLARHDQELAPTSAGVPVVGRDHLLDVLRSTPPRLDPDDVANIGGLLARRLTRDLIPGQSTGSSVGASRVRSPWPSTWTPWRR